MVSVVSSAVMGAGGAPETPGSGDTRPDSRAGYVGVCALKFIQLNIYHVPIVYIAMLYFLTLFIKHTPYNSIYIKFKSRNKPD